MSRDLPAGADPAALAALAARVARLEDLEAVRATWLDYCNRLDTEDLGALADVFCADAQVEIDGLGPGVDGTYVGRDRIVGDFYATTISPSSPARHMTGHLSTNMQIDLQGDEAATLAYFFEIVDDNLVLIGTYQHRMRREADRWRFGFLRISVRYRGRLSIDRVRGQSLRDIVARPV
ncbi:MAG: nuclear transport factor 2 family protein [Acidimicrobiia bacterium]|nr:nuclear transport factor 2 family protein [Acidimicrobiia bacterium]